RVQGHDVLLLLDGVPGGLQGGSGELHRVSGWRARWRCRVREMVGRDPCLGNHRLPDHRPLVGPAIERLSRFGERVTVEKADATASWGRVANSSWQIS
ncbi:MAG TPA: hypothetical protein VEQ37_05095, partial [Actinomycetota bacterium]|nr:hypothetical protein [Actinomycetota bacterium]